MSVVSVHPYDTALGIEWRLVGKPTLDGGRAFVQRSAMRGRPWLRFLRRSDAPDDVGGSDGWYVAAFGTKREALDGRTW